MPHVVSQVIAPIRNRLDRTGRAVRRGAARCIEVAGGATRRAGRLLRR